MAVPLVCLAIIPPIQLNIPYVVNSSLWFWCILLAGVMGMLFLYTKADLLLKILAVYLFINCFRSRAPYLSFTAYAVFILVAYYYLICISLKDFEFVKKIAQAVFFLNIILIVNQQFGGDKLLNFGRTIPVCFGSIGNPMWLGSLLICISPFLLLHKRLNIFPLALAVWLSHSYGAMISILAGLFVYLKGWKKLIIVAVLIFSLFIARGKMNAQIIGGRWPVWKKTVQLANKYPLTGFGIGTYKVILPALSQDVAGGLAGSPWVYEGTEGYWLAWRQAHNMPLQILFETGYIGLGLFLGWLGWLFYRFYKIPKKTDNLNIAIIGMAMIGVDTLFHYPDRLIQCVLFLIVFLAFFKKELDNL